MGPTVIITCSRCGGLLMATEGQRSRSCPYCGSRIDLQKAKRVAGANTAFEASEILRELKSKKQSNSRQTKLK